MADKLPLETFDQVFLFLSAADICRVRLVCKTFAQLSSRYLCPNVYTALTPASLAKLRSLSQCENVAVNVRSWEYCPLTGKQPKMSYDEYQEILNYNPYELPWESYLKYDALVRGQIAVLEAGYDYDTCLHALPRFPRLRHITLNFDHRDDDDMSPWVYERAGPQHLDTLLRVLNQAGQEIRLRTLVVRDLDWHFFDRDDSALGNLLAPLANIKNLCFDINDSYVATLDDSSGDDFRACRQLMRTGVLRKCLPALKVLDALEIGFQYWDSEPDELVRSCPLLQIIPPSFTWEYLKSLSLCHIDCDRHQMMRVLVRHRQTLRSLCLRNVYLRDTCWIFFLRDIQKQIYLTKACICGFLEGCHEDSEVYQNPQIWYFPSGDTLGSAVNLYILEGGKHCIDPTICPLSVENCIECLKLMRTR